MKRRQFTQGLLAIPALPLLNYPAPARRRNTVPQRLKTGDTVGLVTPGSYLTDDGLQRAYTQIEGLGLKVKPGKNIRAERGYLAGEDAQRLYDLHAMFGDPTVKAVWAARGGYGCGRLLPGLDFELIERNPKILIGYSDITALLNAITLRTGIVTYHGPVGSSEFTEYTREHLINAIMDGGQFAPIFPPAEAGERYVITPGSAGGQLWGGNLSLLAAAAGTEYAPPVEGNILFIEEIGEKPYRVDRMLTQLRQAWPLETAAAIVLGVFADCEADADDRSLTLRQTLTDRLGDLGIPVAYGFPIGHIKNMCTLPVGVGCRVDTEKFSLRIEI
ncbi:muramoyltetrapeptide carboxypeptidase [Lewinella aquimaris]|uniref:Muramoyltetrapeptide carboxypeptidase n=1 Tax=Neolewinella aquimaris TaxID=1835722 RepID=A0A840E6Y3_9BACT|nr:LD-carboxypeptidase [Neolewinella aquimaris]MBB4077559.1 muramoyltetrapeptide carboxypeptidase [Neolewinella aquimaris]